MKITGEQYPGLLLESEKSLANEEQLSILKQGVEVWNKWRSESKGVVIDPAGAHLKPVHLNKANLSAVDLSEADRTEADLRGAALWGTKFRGTRLIGTNFTNAWEVSSRWAIAC